MYISIQSFAVCLLHQCLDRKLNDAAGSEGEGPSGLASRTRSKRPLVDVPLGQLEAELLPPDITADMYEQSGATEDRHWAAWLQGLASFDNEGAHRVLLLQVKVHQQVAHARVLVCRILRLFSFFSFFVVQRKPKTRTTPSTTSWTIWTSRTWRTTERTGPSRSPVGPGTWCWTCSGVGGLNVNLSLSVSQKRR